MSGNAKLAVDREAIAAVQHYYRQQLLAALEAAGRPEEEDAPAPRPQFVLEAGAAEQLAPRGSHGWTHSCPHASAWGIPARAADGDIIGALEEVVDHVVRRGVIPPERREHAVGWCFGWLTTISPDILCQYCVHAQAITAVTIYPGEEVTNA
jgi:hypothetical protein